MVTLRPGKMFFRRSAPFCPPVLSTLVFCALTLRGADLPPEFPEVGVWRIPAAALGTYDVSGTTPLWIPLAGFAARDGADPFDATEFVRALGHPRIPGAEATYDPRTSLLIVKSTDTALRKLGDAISLAGLESPKPFITGELRIYECRLKPDSANGFVNWPTWQEIVGQNEAPPRLLDRISGAMRSGKRSRCVRRGPPEATGPDSPAEASKNDDPQNDDLLDGAAGIAVDMEAVAGPDDVELDISLSFQWRENRWEGNHSAISLSTFFAVRESTPLVIHASSRKDDPEKFLIVTTVFQRTLPVEWSLESLRDAAKKASELERLHAPPPPESASP